LEEEMKAIAEKSEKVIANALIIGGALALSYILVNTLSSSGKRASKAKKAKAVARHDEERVDEIDSAEEPGIVSQLGNVLLAQATTFLLTIAREKLVEFLQSQAAKKGSEHERA